ncbi:MAG TPA: hypothetical protein ENL21_02940 [Caldithrix abyssi]|uniref:Uncharacterized protein n=1 Tax=Caldithrix abyssi TaxID=187145 RepID=A0A7V5H2Y7_CALAY|nr:hypothetical protein [Caldithrix abyssi]
MLPERFKEILLLTIFGTAGSILTGYVVFGRFVFVVKSPFFQFMSGGLLASVLFALFFVQREKDALFSGVIIFLFTYLISGGHFFLTQLLYFLGIAIAIYIFARWGFSEFSKFKFLRPLILISLFAVSFFLVQLILTLIYYSDKMPILPFKTVPIGALMGLGVAIGFEVADWVRPKLEKFVSE